VSGSTYHKIVQEKGWDNSEKSSFVVVTQIKKPPTVSALNGKHGLSRETLLAFNFESNVLGPRLR
jgi:hypothetical protein